MSDQLIRMPAGHQPAAASSEEGISPEFASCDNTWPNETERPVDWNGEIARHIALLTSMVRTSEEGFLALGSQLQSIYLSTQEISRKLGGLVKNFSSKEGTDSLAELQDMAEQSAKQLDLFKDFSLQAVDKLQNIESPLYVLPESLREFDRLVSRLRMMGISARIEAARIGQDGFGFVHLAEEVAHLAEQITSKAREVSSHIGGVGEIIALNERKLEGVIEKHKDISESVSRNMRSSLVLMDEKLEMSRRTTSGISGKSEEAIRNINVVVQSVQYHDITRQQIDHIVEALQSINGQDSVLEVVPICQVQAAHLKRAGSEFQNALRSIVTALGDLSNAVTMMLSESEQMTNFTADSGNTFFVDIEQGLQTVSGTMMKDLVTVTELVSSLQEITGKVRQMKTFMDEMTDVGSEVELLALNSRVKAAKAGCNGAALAVIAESIQSLSVDARLQIDEVVGHISRMVSLSEDIKNGHSIQTVTNSAEAETQHIIGKLKDAIEVLRLQNGESIEIFRETEQACTIIVGRLVSLADEISRHRDLAHSVIDTANVLQRLAEQLRASVPDSTQAVIDERLEEMLKRYTMETERTTHRAVLGGDEARPAGSSAGGEIELF